MAVAAKHTNRLIHESSPYLLQHAHNPVDWYPWGSEAFDAARRENKPIFLSVGYSTCYWCHVMERECFENEQIAREMNKRFVNIKVDREERPDVDQLYMLAVQILTRHGGWPMSVFLTPDLQPFYGGTYITPVDTGGRAGFLTIIRALDAAYHEKPAQVKATCAQLVRIIEELSQPQPPQSPITVDAELLNALVDRSIADHDEEHGGFGPAPKFPRQTLLELLLACTGSDSIIDEARRARIGPMLARTLDAMARGGIRDQLGGAFHRYSTDERWLVPHFEIMLYDNAMLAWVYAEAFRQTGQPRHGAVARRICDFVLREMTSPAGAFHTAFDAEVDGQEGASYLWTRQEVRSALEGFDERHVRLFERVYGLDRGPNFEGRNILHVAEPPESAARSAGMTAEHAETRLEAMRARLYEARRRRKQPTLDRKVITSWNALMIRALAHAGRVLDEHRYTRAAREAAQYLLGHHLTDRGVLHHTGGHPQSFLDDYAFLAEALLELGRRDEARSLAEQMVRRFGDGNGGFYFTPREASDLIVRQKTGSDSPLPCGNAVAARVLLELDQAEAARKTLAVFASALEQSADSMSAMVRTAIQYVRRNTPFTVSPWPSGTARRRAPSPLEMAAAVVAMGAQWVEPRELLVRIEIAQGYHLNAHQASHGLIPTRLAVDGDAAKIVEYVDYPPGEQQVFAFASEPVRVYIGTVEVAVRFKQTLPPGRPLLLRLSYQACDYDACLPPVTQELQVSPPEDVA